MYSLSENNFKGISVAMTTYNGENYLREQLDSIFNQSFKPNEIIVCDDGSNDNTIEILKEYENKGLLKLYINKKNLGVISNFKLAVSHAKPGNYIAFADQDDIWQPNKLKLLHSAILDLEQSDENLPAAVYSDLILIDKNKNVLNKSFWNELNHDVHEHCLKTLFFGNFVTGCTMLINNSMKKEFQRMPELNILHDVWIAYIGNSIGGIKAISEPLVLYRQHENNQTYQEGNRKISKWDLRKKRFRRMFLKNDYLKEEYRIASEFLSFYEVQLTRSHKFWIRLFLSTEHLPYIFKEIALKIFFWGKWK